MYYIVAIGSLPTCSVCNTAHEMMRNKFAWSEEQRTIVLQFLRLHLKQQQTERLRLELVKKKCATEFGKRLNLSYLKRTGLLLLLLLLLLLDSVGNPKNLFIYADAMTESAGDSPKEGCQRHSTPGKVIKNRLFAVQIVCGSIDNILYISVDQTMPGGANIAVEIQRVALDYLSKVLESKKQLMPRTQYWQFDNCGENKVINLIQYK